jgi:F-type H+-transporting ATPase subunit b
MNYKDSPHLIEVFDFDILHMELNTPLFIFVLVLVVMFFMNRLLFRPVLRTLDNRARHRKALGEAAAGHRVEIARLTEDYEARLSDVRAEVARLRAEGAHRAQQEVSALLEQARQAAQADLQAALADLGKQREQARRELDDASRRLAEQTTNRILHA